MKLTSGKLLRLMEPDREYCPSELAERFETSTARVNGMLCTLVEDGLVRMSSHSSRIIRFERLAFEPAQPGAPARKADDTLTSIATPPVTRTLQGSLRGYEASLASLRGLAMAARHSWRG